MLLPKKLQNNQSGQILVVFLLILVVGLALTLSIASRTVTDVRQTTTSDESNQAYFAAEAGIENALKQIEANINFTGGADIDFSDVNRSSADVGVDALIPPNADVAFEFPNLTPKDDVAQLNLLSTFSNLATAGVGTSILNNDRLEIFWGDPDDFTTNFSQWPALEVSVVTCDTVCNSGTTFSIYKMIVDPYTGRGTPSFCDNIGGVNFTAGSPFEIETTEGLSRRFAFRAQINFASACSNNDTIGAGQGPVLARIRPLYNVGLPTSIAVLAKNSSGSNKQIPRQGSRIVSTGKTPSGVARKLTVSRLYPALPAIFDYVLYNGSSTTLTKP